MGNGEQTNIEVQMGKVLNFKSQVGKLKTDQTTYGFTIISPYTHTHMCIYIYIYKIFLTKPNCLLLEDDDIHYHFQRFLVNGYITFRKQVLKNYYNKIDIYMLNSYPNFVVDQNSQTNKINFL